MDEMEKEMKIYLMPQFMDIDLSQFIINQSNKCCCKIAKGKGSGFLCKIFLPNLTSLFSCLITNNHVLGKDDILKGKEINFSLENDKRYFSFIIDDSRITYTNKEFNFTIIEIKANDNLDINSFLEVDQNISDNNALNYFQKRSIYLLHYPFGKNAGFSYGIIRNISKYNYIIYHNCFSEHASLGAPLINVLNKKVIGIHTGSIKQKSINTGISLKPVIDDFFKEKSKELKIFNDIKDIKICNENKNNENLNINNKLDLSLKFENSFYFLILILTISFNCNLYKDLIPDIFFCEKKKKINYQGHVVIFFIFDIISGIISFILEVFIKFRIIIVFFSLILFLFDFSPFQVIGLKLLKTSIFDIIPIWNNKMIIAIIIGEIISNIFLYFIYPSLKTNYSSIEDRFKEDENINYGFLIFNLISIIYIIIYSLILFIFSTDFNKIFIEKKVINFKKHFYMKKRIFKSLILLNYCCTFSLFPLLFFLPKPRNWHFTEETYMYFIIFDIIGRVLAIQIKNKINKNIFKIIWFLRIIVFLILFIYLQDIETKYLLISISMIGILSGFCTSFAYYYPLNKQKEWKRENYIYFLKSGKYYAIYKLFTSSFEKLPISEKKIN